MVFDCDYEAKEIMNRDEQLKRQLKEGLGNAIYNVDGSLNRQEMAKEIFNDKDKRDYVNSLVHEAVRKSIEERRKKITGFFFIESAIISTGGISPMCDKIWVVTAPEEVRIERVENRDNLTRDQIEKRIQSQESEFEALPKGKILRIKNGNDSRVLPEVLKITDRYKNLNTYSITTC